MKLNGIDIRVINGSFGGLGYSQAMRDWIARLGEEGVLFVASAGNDAIPMAGYPEYIYTPGEEHTDPDGGFDQGEKVSSQ